MDKSALLASRLPEGEVELPGVGVIRVRGLSRFEALHSGDLDGEEREVYWLSCGIVEPALTKDEIKRWRDSATYAEVELVADRIAELSGMKDTSAKEATKSPGDESGA